MMALSLTFLAVAAGLVLDFGQVRSDKQTNKSTADSVALAGANALDTGDFNYHSWNGVCTALAYLRVNDSRFGTLAGTYKNGAGGAAPAGSCSGASVPADTACVANNPSSWAWWSGTTTDGKLTVDIKSGYALPDSTFPEDSVLTGDNGDSTLGGCDQLAVIVSQTEKPGLGSLVTSSNLVTRLRSVARSSPNTGAGVAAIALLLLERHDCNTLQAGSTNTYFDILGNGPAPGVIHSDSIGNGSCLPSDAVLAGKFAGHIKARHAETGGLSGLITTTAAQAGVAGAVPSKATDGAANVCAEQIDGSCAAATGRPTVGRGIIDTRYLTPVKAAMTSAASAYNLTAATAAATPYNYTVWPSSPTCNLNGTPPAAAVIFVNCTGAASINTVTFSPTTTTVIFPSTSVTLAPSSQLTIPNAQRVYIKGSSGTGSLDVKGTLKVNLGSPAASLCSGRTTAGRDQLVIGDGSFSASSTAELHLCNTTVLMAGGYTGLVPGGCPPPAVVTPIITEPADNSCTGTVNLGAQGSVDWSAPNLVSTVAVKADWDQLEDLALWTETSAGSSIGGGSTMLVSGIFFLPNCNPFTLSGGGLQSNGANAQFISRKLVANGQGTLYMKPNPNDVATLPLPANIGLVR